MGKKTQKFLRSTRHIKSLDACMEFGLTALPLFGNKE
jgi:hypothetical protein